jgi:light-regulated signal transduction histidine kinase (bacteriophytochrome)
LPARGSIKNAEVEIRAKSGALIPVLVSTETIAIGQQKYYLHALNDITELKKSEREIEKKNQDLEKMNKELEAFTYISSHDLQEPLRKIQTFATRLLEKENQNLSETGKDYFHRMQEAANKMQNFINDLLALTRISTSERTYERQDLGQLIQEVISEFKDVIHAKNASIEIGDMCEINIIPFQFRQLVQNLLSNALKFSRSDIPPHIEIFCEFIPAHSTYILKGIAVHHIVFRDNGIGFEQRFSEQIFQLFQRLHAKDEYRGTESVWLS